MPTLEVRLLQPIVAIPQIKFVNIAGRNTQHEFPSWLLEEKHCEPLSRRPSRAGEKLDGRPSSSVTASIFHDDGLSQGARRVTSKYMLGVTSSTASYRRVLSIGNGVILA